jgi:hypothetical protein
MVVMSNSIGILLYSFLKNSCKIKGLALFLLFFNTSCAYLTYGLSDSPSGEGCEIQSYRKPDGNLHYYLIGNKCKQETIERIRVRNEKAVRGF